MVSANTLRAYQAQGSAVASGLWRRHAARTSAPGAAATSSRRPRLAVFAVAAPVRESDGLTGEASQLEQAVAAAEAAYLRTAAAPDASRTNRIVLESEEELRSTPEHRAWVYGGTALMAATLAHGLGQVDGSGAAAVAGTAALAAYFMADVGTAFYHWGVDNYGDGSTPVFGGQIAAFQGHHQRPWTITEREFCNNLHKLFRPATPIAAVLLGMALAGAPVWWDVWSSTFLYLCCMSQQLHAWSHMKKSELPPAIVAMQDAGLLISRKEHGAHHKAPFDCKYAIVSGWCNPLLDGNSPENSVWMKLEQLIAEKWGVEPRSWHEPDAAWQEQERPGQAA